MISEIKSCAKILASNIMRLHFPYKLTLALTYRCNQRCKICSIWKKTTSQELSFEELDNFFSLSNKFAWVSLTGGEVFLRQDLIPVIGTIVSNCRDLCVLSIPTNGFDTALIVEKTKEILSLRLRRLYITISLDGPPELHDILRGSRDSWKRSINTFLELKKNPKLNVYLSMTISALNVNRIYETLRAIKDAYPLFDEKRDMNFNIFHTSEHFYGNKDDNKPDSALLQNDIDTAMQLLYKRNKIKGFLQYNYLKHCKAYVETHRSPVQCKALSASCFMSPDGEIYPCHIYDQPLGNIKAYKFDLNRMWNTERTLKVYKDAITGNCPGCWSPCEAYESLIGSLPASIYAFLRHHISGPANNNKTLEL